MCDLPKPFLCQVLKCERRWKSLLGDLQLDGSMVLRALQGAQRKHCVSRWRLVGLCERPSDFLNCLLQWSK